MISVNNINLDIRTDTDCSVYLYDRNSNILDKVTPKKYFRYYTKSFVSMMNSYIEDIITKFYNTSCKYQLIDSYEIELADFYNFIRNTLERESCI